MSTKDSVDVPPVGQIERPSSLIPIDDPPRATSVIASRQIYALMAYYWILLVGCIAVVVLLILNSGSILKADSDDLPANMRLLASMAFLVSGAILGSIL